ncbi:MAG: DUF1624 domain-containing protein [Pyrinomonadaceae bacterium]
MKRRIFAVDLLRGIVMMIMLLDHTRDFVYAGALQSDPTDPSTTTVAVFFTRWITHFCAPVFVFLSGVSIYLQRLSGKSNAELARFLWTRGLWLIFLEFTLIRFLVIFNFDYSLFGMPQVIWVIGVSMIVMAALIYAPVRAVGIAGVTMIFLHNLLDPIQVPPQIAFAGTPPPNLWQSLWITLHQQGLIPLPGGSQMFVLYPLIPWIGVMMAGYALGVVYSWESERRRKLLLQLGLVATVLFVVVRFANVYGDPVPWRSVITPPIPRAAAVDNIPLVTDGAATPVAAEKPEPRGNGYVLLSFLNTTKYPVSLLFLLMTLGPALIVLALADGIDGQAIWQRICITFGRVPLFFYILQWIVAHGGAVLLSWLAGKDASYLFLSPLEMSQSAPPEYGFSLSVVYAIWIAGLILVYPLCAWFAALKKRNRHWVLSYL